MNKPERKYVIKRENLNEEYYFQSLLQQAERFGLLTDSEMENIKLQSIQILTGQIEKYTKGDSSSVKTETAQSIMLSIFYCIGIYLKNFQSPDISIIELKQKPLNDLYKEGTKLVEIQISRARELLKAVQQSKVDTDNQAYNDTLDEGIESFFSSYDADFAAHNTTASIDYQLSNDKMNMAGSEYIYNYLYKLLLENKFCENFSFESINDVLKSYNEHYEELLVNIFERVLINALGSMMRSETAIKININEQDLKYLQKKLENKSEEQLYILLQATSERMFSELNIVNEDLKQYILETVKNLPVTLKNALENNKLEAVFVSIKEKNENEVLQYEDGQKMEDELFRKISVEIRDCRYVDDKIAIIKENIHSIIDLVDIFEGTCIFENEFNKVFASLGDMELSLLLKTLPIDEEDSLSSNRGYEEQWQNKLVSYIKELGFLRSNDIKNMGHKIHLE